MAKDLNNPEYVTAADRLIGIIKSNMALDDNNKSPDRKEVLKIAKKILESRA